LSGSLLGRLLGGETNPHDQNGEPVQHGVLHAVQTGGLRPANIRLAADVYRIITEVLLSYIMPACI
jgi:hypothetical protein